MCIYALSAASQRVSVLGDSYSTYEGFMTPSTNELWYYAKNDTAKTDVSCVQDTWAAYKGQRLQAMCQQFV